MAHLKLFWSALSLRAKLLFLKNWRGSLVVVGLSRREVTWTAGIGLKVWWESLVLAICLGFKIQIVCVTCFSVVCVNLCQINTITYVTGETF